MGRKIPAKKHRGVKDPLVQQARRERSLKSKINAPPKDPDEQPVPKSLSRLFAFQNKDVTEKPKKKKNLKRLQHENKSGHGDNPIAKLHKLPGESGRGFSLRINSAIRALHGHVTEEDSYPLDTEDAEDVKGARMADFNQYRDKKAKRAARAAPGGQSTEKEAKLTRTQKQALKKKAQKERQQETQKDLREVVYERVAFGDVSHAPPALNFNNKKLAATAGAPRPGRRDLLLNKLLNPTQESSPAACKPSTNVADALRRERARLDAVQAYRDLKKNNKNKLNKT